MYKQKNSNTRNFPVIISFVLLALVTGITSCKSKDEGSKTETASVAPEALATTVTLPMFKWNRTEIQDLFGEGKKNPGKMLIKIGHTDYNRHIATMKLYVYPAKDHKQYAQDEDGIELVKGDNAPAINNRLMIGNNDFDFDKFFTGTGSARQLKEFNYALFVPTAIDDDNGKTHLVFHIYLVRGVNFSKDTDEDLGNTNPSPPADPSHNDD